MYIYIYIIYNIYVYILYIYMQSWKQCAILVITTNRTSCAQVHELPQSQCGDNWEGTLFS